MTSASPSASSLAAAAHRRPRWTSPRATPSLPTTTMLSTLSSLHPRPRTKTRTSARRWRSKACVSAHSRTVPLPPTSVRRRVCQRIRRRCRCCRRRAVALPPPPQPPCCLFGLTKLDYEDLFEGKEKAWKAPSKTEKRRNAKWIDRIRKMMMREDQGE